MLFPYRGKEKRLSPQLFAKEFEIKGLKVIKEQIMDKERFGHIDSLEVIRAIAFLGVFLYHAIRTFPGEGAIYKFFAKSLGPWGVSVFFVLSGFLMTYSYWDRPPKNSFIESILFSIKKVKKLYPLHLVMLFVGAIYYLRLQHKTIITVIKNLAITIPLIQTWMPVGYQAINSVAWYLSVCVFLYFCFPCLLSCYKKYQKRPLLSVIVILIIFFVQLLIGYCVFHYTDIDIRWVTYCHPFFRLGDFAIGGLLASIYLTERLSETPNAPLPKLLGSVLEIVSIALNVIVCIFHANSSKTTAWFTYTSLFIPSTVLLICVFSLNNGVVSDLLANKITFWLAAISPYAFLIHRLVIYYFTRSRHIIHWRRLTS